MSAPVQIIIPTWNNTAQLRPCLQSLLNTCPTEGLFHVWVVNNGHPDSCKFIGKDHPTITVVQPDENLGWEGGLKAALPLSDSPFVLFLNDDTFFLPANRYWLHMLLERMGDPLVGAVGPASNTVMGAQNMLNITRYSALPVNFLIGFCLLVRRSALEECGGVDATLPGGDDIDLSIRLQDAGYKLIATTASFVYHYGFGSGQRKHGAHYNSPEMTETTNHALIRKHGLKKWFLCLYGPAPSPEEYWNSPHDSEGVAVRKLIGRIKSVLELGVGATKTVEHAVGVDFVPKGQPISTLAGAPLSVADVVADVSGVLPFDDGAFGCVVARHVLEHLIDPVAALLEWKRVLKTGGKLILALPDQDIRNTVPLNLEHVHAYTKKSATSLLSSLGFTAIEAADSGNQIGFTVTATK